ncbi:MAG: hypothetical protein HY329_27845 [Chloroflexi bacterium]|nr:hypothetical protein [Chloroflexota bacterium]
MASSGVSLDEIRSLLTNLAAEWPHLATATRRRLLLAVLDRIELRHDRTDVRATVHWRYGLQQTLYVRRPGRSVGQFAPWPEADVERFRALRPATGHVDLMAAFPGRTWDSFKRLANTLGLERQYHSVQVAALAAVLA